MKNYIPGFLPALFGLICCTALFPASLRASGDWLYFARDINAPGTKYYYDLESLKYFADDHLSVWIKIGTKTEGQTLLTEINCSGRLFRAVQPPEPTWNGWFSYFETKRPLKTQYVASGWHEIPPDSEMNILRRQLCNYPKKDWQ